VTKPSASKDSCGDKPLTAGDLQRRAISGSFWTAVNALVGVPVAFIANAVVARYLGVTDYGRLAFLTLGLSLAVQVTNFGVSDSTVRWGAVAHAMGKREQVDRLLRKSLGYHLLFQLPLLVATVLWLSRGSALLIQGVLLVSVAVPAALGSAALSLSIENRLAAGAKLALVSGVAVQTAVAVTAVLSQSPVAVWATRSVAGCVLLPLNFLLLDRARRAVALKPKLPKHLPPGFWRYASFSFAAALVATLVFSRSELFLLQSLGGPVALGTFALAFGLSQQVTSPADALVGPLLPAISALVSAHPSRSVPALLRATRFAALICGVLTGVAIPALYFLVPLLYGSEFRPSAALFLPLAFVSCLQSVSHPVNTFTRARGRNDILLRAYCWALVVDLVLAVSLILLIGVWGAVLANVFAQSFALIAISNAELTYLGVPRRHYLSAIAFLGVGSAIGLLTLVLVTPFRLPPLLGAPLAGSVGLALLCMLSRLTRTGVEATDGLALVDSLPRALREPVGHVVKLFQIRP
jgi:O-antigen/teichoic acid export membrane protein